MEDKWEKSIREDNRYQNRRERENPSFSSTLLDAIYRSIDEGHGREAEENLVLYRETMRKKHNNYSTVKSNGGFEDEKERANLRRACLIEKWMEKKVSEKVVVRRISADRDSLFLNSSSSSSDSSCGGVFSSSEAESMYGVSSGYAMNMNIPKPIRTRASIQPEKFSKENARNVFDKYQQHHEKTKTCVSQQKPKNEGGGFVKTKSRALKIYGDLKKFKQPISPGSKLASFLNSIFTAGNTKKAKFSSAGDDASLERKSKSAHASTCSSASSISRSCLSKTGKLSNGTKRSVRFDSVKEIVAEPKLLAAVKTGRNSVNNEELKFHIKEKNRRVEEAARDLLRNYQKKVECEFALGNDDHNKYREAFDDDEDEDDAASYASSDLFELDNLSAIGIEMYREELPVYETTHFDTNRAIANGLIL